MRARPTSARFPYTTLFRSATFEEPFEEARHGTVLLKAARYPPSCSVESGTVQLSLGPSGAMIVHVEPGACSEREFRRSEEHTSELQSRRDLVCRLLLEKKQ